MTTLDLHGGINKYAVYNGVSDAPLTDPMNNLPNLLWHSDLKYLGVSQTFTGTVNLDINTSGWVGTPSYVIDFQGNQIPTTTYPYKYTLATHGKSYSPFFLGYIEINGVKVSLNGTFLFGYMKYNVASDGTSVYLSAEPTMLLSYNHSVTCNYKVHVLNAGTDATDQFIDPPYYAGFDATATRLQCGYFDTNNRYIIKDAAGELVASTGATVSVIISQPRYVSQTCRGVCVVFKSGSYTHEDLSAGPLDQPASGFNSPYYRMSVK